MDMPFDVATLLASVPEMGLVHGSAAADAVREALRAARVPEIARAGLYLRAGFWDEAHEVAQSIENADGSYWHAIVHRQEPDAGNASYWFRRVGRHAIYPDLGRRAAEIEPALSGSWDPYRFIEYCERAARQPGSEMERRAVAIQNAEWELLFEHSMRSGTVSTTGTES